MGCAVAAHTDICRGLAAAWTCDSSALPSSHGAALDGVAGGKSGGTERGGGLVHRSHEEEEASHARWGAR